MPDQPPVIAITPGEPAGVGPELVQYLPAVDVTARLVVIADPDLLRQRSNMELPLWQGQSAAGIYVQPVALRQPSTVGKADTANARYVLDTLDLAIDSALRGDFHALVTGPVHKAIINAAGYPFTGHTEYLAERSGIDRVVMMLATKGLRVALATTHLPLTAVPAAITRESLESTLRILDQDLKTRFAIDQPRISVCGLNPHAGEGGYLGREEIDTIVPVVEALKKSGLHLDGPLPADTAFTPEALHNVDAVLAMYHDQGLPVLKHAGFGKAINITLGLPFIRTSVDHGTALDLAGTGMASADSLLAALAMAAELAGR